MRLHFTLKFCLCFGTRLLRCLAIAALTRKQVRTLLLCLCEALLLFHFTSAVFFARLSKCLARCVRVLEPPCRKRLHLCRLL